MSVGLRRRGWNISVDLSLFVLLFNSNFIKKLNSMIKKKIFLLNNQLFSIYKVTPFSTQRKGWTLVDGCYSTSQTVDGFKNVVSGLNISNVILGYLVFAWDILGSSPIILPGSQEFKWDRRRKSVSPKICCQFTFNQTVFMRKG